MFFVTLLIVLFNLVSIHLSSVFKSLNSSSVNSSIFIKTNLDAFHNLLMKFQVDFTFSSSYLRSVPAAALVVKKNLNASAP